MDWSSQPELVIILAPPRCFTTLVSAMLGQHPQMYGLPETYLFTAPTMLDWWAAHQGTDHVDGLSRAVAQIVYQSQTENTIELARRWLRRPRQKTADVMRALADRVSPAILVEKTPQTAEHTEHLQRIVSEFPNSRFLHLLRHPFGQVHSRLQRRMKNLTKQIGASSNLELVDVAQRFGGRDPQMLWYRCNANIVAFLQTLPPEQHMRVRAEHLLADPDLQLHAIARWLNLRSDPPAIEAMKHPECSPFACFGPANARMGGDENFFADPILRPHAPVVHSLEAPLPWRTDGAPFLPQIQALAQQLGYS